MEQEKVAKIIKDIREKNNLTQKQFADKYNVTYQAVSKWENALNMPDTSLMMQICNDYGLSLDDLLDVKTKKKNTNKLYFIILLIVIIIIFIIFIIFFFKMDDDFEFKTLSTKCDNFNISGNISYNKTKSAIYITNIKYCGGEDNYVYKQIECLLYESNNDVEVKISSYKSKNEGLRLDEFLQNVTLSVDKYEKTCDKYRDNSLYLLINATDFNNKIITYKIPLELVSCNSN